MSHRPNIPSNDLGPRQAAHWLGVSVRTLDQWRQFDRGPPYHRLEKQIRYRVIDLEAWYEGVRHVPACPYGAHGNTGAKIAPSRLSEA
jgi:hypothetical protein